MAQNVTVCGASYTGVPAVQLPKTGGGSALFLDATAYPKYATRTATVSSNTSGLINLEDFMGVYVPDWSKVVGIIAMSKTNPYFCSGALYWSNGHWYVWLIDPTTWAVKESTSITLQCTVLLSA